MLLPIALILLAIVIDAFYLGWMAYRMWHDEWGVRVGDYMTGHVFRPIRNLAHPHHPVG
ncbi:MAG TPA: hypothetical protein VF981_13380 [Gemmatimonadaceae bacterium]